MEKIFTVIVGLALGVLIFGAIIGIPALVVWLLWMKVVVPAFHAPILTFWQVFGILWLLSIVSNFIKGLV